MSESYEQFLESRRIPSRPEPSFADYAAMEEMGHSMYPERGRMPDSWGENWYQELVGVAYSHLVEEESPSSIIRLLVDHYGIDLDTARKAVEEARRALKLTRGYA